MSYRLTLGLIALCACGASAALAEPVPITVRAYDEDPGGKTLAEPVEAQVGAALSADRRFAFTSITDRLEPPVEAARALGRADLAIIDAETAFQQMDLDKAKELITGAIAAYQRYLPELAVRGGGVTPLRDAWIKMAKTRFFNGDLDGARDALRYVFVLDPKLEYDPTTFPPQMKKMIIEAKLLFETLGPGKLVIDSDPNGAVAWLNGQKVEKPTPTDAMEAPPGPSYVSVRRRGWAPLTTVVEVNGSGDQATALESLTRYPKHPIADLERARAHLDESDTPPGLKTVADVLGVKMLVLIRFAKVAEPTGDTRLTAYLFDARPNRILKRASIVTTAAGAPSAAHALAGEVVRDVRLDGIYVPPKPPVKPNWWQRFTVSTRDDFDRFHHWKYFWYVVGGAAGAVALGVGLGVGIGVTQHQQTVGQAVILLGGS